MMFQRRRPRRRPEINVVPLIDVLCFLVVFFMLFSVMKTNQTGMDINLPKAERVTSSKADSQVVVSVNRDGQVYFEGRAMSKPDMQEQVRLAVGANPETLVIIKADRQALYAKIIETMDIVRKVGAYKLALAADRDKPLL